MPVIPKISTLEGSCAPTALQYLSQCTDAELVEACIAQGMNDPDIIKAGKLLGLKLISVQMMPMEVRKFLQRYKTGAYMVSTHNHIFVVQDGVMVDPRLDKPPGTRRILKQAWKVL